METDKRFFPSQQKEEKVILVIRKHWFNYLIFFFLAFFMLAPVVLLLIYWGHNPGLFSKEVASYIVVGLSIYTLFLIGVELYGFVNYYLDVYIVTDQRIVDISQDGFFKRKISELHLRQIQDVSAKVSGFFQTVLHFGDVYIQTAGERENFVFISVPHPYSVSKRIIELHQSHLEENNHTEVNFDFNSDYNTQNKDDDNIYEKIELQAKKIIKDTPVIDKITNGGICTSKHNDSTVPFDDRQFSVIISKSQQGQMIEGKEINIDNEVK